MSAPKIPYPPSPAEVPEGLTDYPDSFTRKQNQLLAGLFVFLIFYIATIILCAMVGVWSIVTIVKWPVVKVILICISTIVFVFLVKGFFKRHPMNKEMQIEITEEDQPVLFEFIHRLCDELDSPEPNKVFVAADIMTGVMSRTSLVNLFVEPKRDLVIGLALVNSMNLSEFKVVLAHEFGHFCHLGPTSSYTRIVQGIIWDMVLGEDWFDQFVVWCKRPNNVLIPLGYALGGCLWLGRTVLWWLYKAISLQDRAVSREQEFHADLVAVSAAGSDAATHGLLRARFGMQCFVQAVDDLALALDHKLYTNDLYLHHDRAAAEVRRKKKDHELGLPPALSHPTAGKSIKVFDAEQDEIEDVDETPPMWRDHPSDADREENAKERFVPAVMDHRSSWILFKDPADLKERMSYKFYRMYFRIPKNADLTDAQRVQEYIDNEHLETTYDPKYHGAYDERILEPGDLQELNSIIFEKPWTEDRMEKVYEKIFEGCKEHAEGHTDLHKELQSLNAKVVGKPSPRVKKLIKQCEEKLDANREWFKSFDRRVYLLHVQMAGVNKDWKQEMVERYRFQMTVQRFYQEARDGYDKADLYMTALFNSSPNELPPDFIGEVLHVLRESWKALRQIVRDAKETNLPAMKNFEEGERLADFILPEKMVPEPPLDYAKGAWIDKLMKQLAGVRMRCFRLHFKSVGGILALQEKIAAAWVEARAPVCAEIVEPLLVEPSPLDAEPIPAEVVVEALVDEVPAEVVPVDAIPAEVKVESFIDALPLDDGVPATPPAALAPMPEPIAPPMAAFVASPQPQAAPVMLEAIVAEVVPEPELVAAGVVELPKSEREKPMIPAPAEPEPVFSLDASASQEGEPVKTAPAKPEPVAPIQLDITFSLDADAAPPAIPVAEVAQPVEPEPPPIPAAAPEVFSLDADAAPPPIPVAEVVEAVDPEPSPATVAEVFSLDAAENPKPSEEVFSLDADAIAEPPKPALPASQPHLPRPTPLQDDDIFSLDSDNIAGAEIFPVAEEVSSLDADILAAKAELAAKSKPRPADKPAVTAPAARPAFGSGTSASMPALSESNGAAKHDPRKRPPVKITLVKPGEKSPFAK